MSQGCGFRGGVSGRLRVFLMPGHWDVGRVALGCNDLDDVVTGDMEFGVLAAGCVTSASTTPCTRISTLATHTCLLHSLWCRCPVRGSGAGFSTGAAGVELDD